MARYSKKILDVSAVGVLTIAAFFLSALPLCGEPNDRVDSPADVVGELDWPEEWVVFGPLLREHPVLPWEVLKTVPETIEVGPVRGPDFEEVAPGRKLTGQVGKPTANEFDFAEIFEGGGVGTTGYAFLTLEAKKAGKVTLGLGADYWLKVWLNGEPILNNYPTGTPAMRYTCTNYRVNVDLKAGRNVMAVRFSRGLGSAVLALCGPNELRAIPVTQWVPVPVPEKAEGKNLVANGEFGEGGTGDPWIPVGWSNGEGDAGFAAGELTVNTDRPMAGETSLEINTLGGGDRTRVVYTRITVTPGVRHEVSYRARHLGGGNVVIMLREGPYSGPTYFLEDGRIGPDKGSDIVYSSDFALENRYVYVIIRARDPAHVIVDHISVRRAPGPVSYSKQRVAWDPGTWHTVSDKIETPHTAWARPYAGGALKVLSMAPRWHQRWTVELAQRLSIDYQTLMFADHANVGGNYWIREGADVRYLDVETDARRKLSSKPDCMVLAQMDAGALRNKLVDAILERVAGGSGLVIREVSSHDFEGYQQGAWAEALGEDNLTDEQTDYVTLGPVEKVEARFYRHGQGRIVLLSEVQASGDLLTAFEHEMAHTIKSILWASRRLPRITIASVRLPGETSSLRAGPVREELPASAVVTLAGEASSDPDLQLYWWLVDGYGETLLDRTVAWPGAASHLSLSLPRIKGGRHYLHLQIRGGGKVYDWTSAVLDVQAQPRVTAIELLREAGKPPYYTRGESIKGVIKLSAAPGADERLRVLLADRDGHLWQQCELNGSGTEYQFALDTDPAVVLVHTIRAQLYNQEGVVSEAQEEVTVVRPATWYRQNHFDHQIWGGGLGDYLGYLCNAALRRDLGLTSSLGIGPRDTAGARSVALNNLRWVDGMRSFPNASNAITGDRDHAPVRDTCLSNPDNLSYMAHLIGVRHVKRRISHGLEAVKYAPLVYLTDHEQNARGRKRRLPGGIDFCFSESCLDRLRELVRSEYGDLPALNAAWSTEFEDWKDVRPLTLVDAMQAGQLPRWVDHRRSMDRVWTQFARTKLESVRRFDPQAQAMADNVFSGNYTLDSWGGIDFWLLLSDVVGGAAMVEPYLESFVPDQRRHLTWRRSGAWAGEVWTGHRDLLAQRFGTRAWQGFMSGMRGLVYYDETWSARPDSNFETSLAADLQPSYWGLIPAQAVAQIRTGIDRLVFESRRDDGGIGLYYSRASEHVCTAWQMVAGGSTARKLDPRRSQFKFFAPALESAGRSYRSVAYGQVEQGMLAEGDIKLLILPFSQAVSRSAAKRIREFVHQGGSVLADIRPAMSDEHGLAGETGLLDDVFGVRHDPDWAAYKPREGTAVIEGDHRGLRPAARIDAALLGPAVEPDGARTLGNSGDVPLVMIHEYGRGKAILLNFSLSELGDAGPAVSGLLDELLNYCGIGKIVGVEAQQTYWQSDGRRIDFDTLEQYGQNAVPGIARYVNGGIDVLGIFWDAMDRGLGRQVVSIQPPRAGHVYDLLTNEYLGRHDRYEAEIPLEGFGVYAVAPYRIEKPQVTVRFARTEAGHPRIESRVRVSPEVASRERHVVRLQLFAPDGAEWRDFAVNVACTDGVARNDFVLPLNAPHGIWRVVAREAISGLSEEGTVEWPSDRYARPL